VHTGQSGAPQAGAILTSDGSRILCKGMPFKIFIQNLVTLFYNYIICIVKL
jgi:hypothetical protein